MKLIKIVDKEKDWAGYPLTVSRAVIGMKIEKMVDIGDPYLRDYDRMIPIGTYAEIRRIRDDTVDIEDENGHYWRFGDKHALDWMIL
jgi:hypothetical protein